MMESMEPWQGVANAALSLIRDSGREIIEVRTEPAFLPPTDTRQPVNPHLDALFTVPPYLNVVLRYRMDEGMAAYEGLNGPDHIDCQIATPGHVRRRISISSREIAPLTPEALARRIDPSFPA